jgi:hypothetical protein
MLVRFAGSNIRSFRDPFELSLLSTAISEGGAPRHIRWREDSETDRLGVLPLAGLFGSNASGKSNVLRALHDMRTIVLNSFRSWSATGRTHREPFRLDQDSASRPSRYEVDLVLNGVLHQYGFALDDERIVEEWAFRYPKGRTRRIFERTHDKIEFGTSTTSNLARAGDLVRPNALFLSTAVALRGDELRPLYEWFERNLLLANAGNRDGRQFFTAKQLEHRGRRERVLALLRAADLGIVDAVEVDPATMAPEFREKVEQILSILSDGEAEIHVQDLPVPIKLVHRGADGNPVQFSADEESLGTAVWLGLAGPIIDALDEGSVLLVDELDASLHPVLVRQIVRLFQSTETNPRRAQLIFNSHDINLLGDSQSTRTLGRDQIWFTEKDESGATKLFALSDLNPRKEEAVGKRYLAGRYGALPIVADADFEDATQLASTH